jgi:hypothetical protein
MHRQSTNNATQKGAASFPRPDAISYSWRSFLNFSQDFNPRGGKLTDEEERLMNEYREFVARVSDSPWPSETIANRSWEHASVIIEFLFRKAENSVEILTSKLTESVYGCTPLIESAKEFLQTHPIATIRILSENNLDRENHPFLREMDAGGFAERVVLKFISDDIRIRYKFNFAVADGKSFRFEDSRDSFEAVVGFGHDKVASRLHTIFMQLWDVS